LNLGPITFEPGLGGFVLRLEGLWSLSLFSLWQMALEEAIAWYCPDRPFTLLIDARAFAPQCFEVQKGFSQFLWNHPVLKSQCLALAGVVGPDHLLTHQALSGPTQAYFSEPALAQAWLKERKPPWAV